MIFRCFLRGWAILKSLRKTPKPMIFTRDLQKLLGSNREVTVNFRTGFQSVFLFRGVCINGKHGISVISTEFRKIGDFCENGSEDARGPQKA